MDLSTYLLAAIVSWLPAGQPPSSEMAIRQKSVADDVAAVASDEAEPVIWKEGRVMSGLVLASLAVLEGGMSRYVDSGECNDRKWRERNRLALAAGDCDGGRAYSLGQIHGGGGLVLLASGGYVSRGQAGSEQEGSQLVTAQDLITDRKIAAKTALHMIRVSVKQSGGLCGYTGERGECPKAKARLEKAKSYLRAHPYLTD